MRRTARSLQTSVQAVEEPMPPGIVQTFEIANAKSMAEVPAKFVRRGTSSGVTCSRSWRNLDAMLFLVCAFPGMEHLAIYKEFSALRYTLTYTLTGRPATILRPERHLMLVHRRTLCRSSLA